MSRRTAGLVALAGMLGWGGFAWLAVRLLSATPPMAGFDLELLLAAGRDVAAGRSPYDPALVAGAAPVAERLFYSYPPVVAQILSIVAGVPSPLMVTIWIASAVGALALVAVGLARRIAPDVSAAAVAASVVALSPLVFPFAIGLLFGNLDVFFPALFGLVLLGVIPGSTRRASVAGGVAAAAAVAKLHPASIGAWLLVRSTEAVRVLAV